MVYGGLGQIKWDEGEEELGKRAKEREVVRAGCYCLLTETYLELSTVCNALDVLLFNGGCSK